MATVRRISDAMAEHPDRLADAVRVLWGEHDVGVQTLSEFERPISEAIEELSPGEVVDIGGILLMARDPAAFPPYRTTPVGKWRCLVGREAVGDSPVERYQELIELCDELIRRAPEADISLAGSWAYCGIMEFTRITVDPSIMDGVPTLRGLQIPVATVVTMVADGLTVDEILLDLPDLSVKTSETRLAAAEGRTISADEVRARSGDRYQ